MQYVAFCAVVILYIHAIQKHGEPREVWAEYLEAGEYCQKTLAPLATEDSLVKRCMIVLEELRIEATTARRSGDDIDDSYTSAHHHRPESGGVAGSINEINEVQQTNQAAIPHGEQESTTTVPVDKPTCDENNNNNNNEWIPLTYEESGISPDSLTTDLTTWDYFDSLVRLYLYNIFFLL